MSIEIVLFVENVNLLHTIWKTLDTIKVPLAYPLKQQGTKKKKDLETIRIGHLT